MSARTLSPGGGPWRWLRAGLAAGALAAGALAAWLCVLGAADPEVTVRLPSGATDHGAFLHEGAGDYVSAADALRWYGATRQWDPALGKLTLMLKGHALRFTTDTRWVQWDRETYQTDAPTLYRRNMVWLPVSALTGAIPDGMGLRARWDPVGRRLEIGSGSNTLTVAETVRLDDRDEITLTFDHASAAERVSTERGSFVLRFRDATMAAGVASQLRPTPLVSSMALQPEGSHLLLRLSLPPQAVGYTLEHLTTPERWKLTISRNIDALEAGRLLAFQLPGVRGGSHIYRVIVDPGHGGLDAGATAGPLRESNITLELARELKMELERTGDVNVVLTRDADQDVPQRKRAETANGEKGDLFVSLHADAAPPGAPAGFAVYTWPLGTGATETPGNATGRGTGISLQSWEDVPARFTESSDALGRNLVTALTTVWTDGGRGLRHRRLLPLEGISMPAAMVECGEVNNPQDADRLGGSNGLSRIAMALASGIRRDLGRPDDSHPAVSGGAHGQ